MGLAWIFLAWEDLAESSGMEACVAKAVASVSVGSPLCGGVGVQRGIDKKMLGIS